MRQRRGAEGAGGPDVDALIDTPPPPAQHARAHHTTQSIESPSHTYRQVPPCPRLDRLIDGGRLAWMRRPVPRLLPRWILLSLLLALLLSATASLAFLLKPPPLPPALASTTTIRPLSHALRSLPTPAVAAAARAFTRTAGAAAASTGGGGSSSFMEAVTPTYIEVCVYIYRMENDGLIRDAWVEGVDAPLSDCRRLIGWLGA